jgi:hypothetical protein
VKFGRECGVWHEWFAWRPVRLTNTQTWIWREIVHRRFQQIGPYSYTYYKAISESPGDYAYRSIECEVYPVAAQQTTDK